MLKVPLNRQKYGHCGPASLKMLLGFFGIKETHENLAKITKATGAAGTPHKNMIAAAKHFGFKVTAHEYGDWDTLDMFINKKKVPVIVDWFSMDDGHYSVAVKLTKTAIWLADPEYAKVRKFSWVMFNRVWFDFTGNWIKDKKDNMFLRWYMALESK